MQMVGRLLSALGGQGPALLVISLCAGLLIQPLAHFGYDLLPFSAFLLTLGSFLTAGLAPSEARIRLPLMALVVAWVGLALPLAAAVLLSFLPLDPALRAGVLLSLLAPPVGSAARSLGCLVCEHVSLYSYPSHSPSSRRFQFRVLPQCSDLELNSTWAR